MRTPRTLSVVVCLVVGAAAKPPALVRTALADTPALSATTTLRDWGIERPRDVAYASVGILRSHDGDRLVIYDLRDHAPVVRQLQTGARKPTMDEGYFLIDHFDRGIRNRLDGYSSAFFNAPSSGELGIDTAPDGVRALRYSYRRAESGFTGFWIHLFDFKSAARTFLDTRETAFLTFRIRGLSGKEHVVLRSADEAWERKGDSLTIGPIEDFLASLEGILKPPWS